MQADPIYGQLEALFWTYWWLPICTTFSGSMRYYQSVIRKSLRPSFFSCLYETLVISLMCGVLGLLMVEYFELSVEVKVIASIIAAHQGEEWMQHIGRIIIKNLGNVSGLRVTEDYEVGKERRKQQRDDDKL